MWKLKKLSLFLKWSYVDVRYVETKGPFGTTPSAATEALYAGGVPNT